jgi:hypothetical protein
MRIMPGGFMKLIMILAIVTIVGTGCATSSGIVEMGQDTYMISRSGSIGRMGVGSMKTDNIVEANEYCKNQGKQIQVLASSDYPATIGNVARAEVQFLCLSKGDPRLKGGPLVPISPAPADKIVNGK